MAFMSYFSLLKKPDDAIHFRGFQTVLLGFYSFPWNNSFSLFTSFRLSSRDMQKMP